MKMSGETANETQSYPRELRIDEHLSLRLSTNNDVDTLVSWLADPAVSKWWSNGEPVSREEVEAKYAGSREPEVAAYIIEHDHQPAGYIQAWQKPTGRGLDMFVSAEMQGKGIGPVVARALATDLTQRSWERITVDPTTDNLQAIRGWEKAGFVTTGEIDNTNDYVTQIMVFHP